MPLFIASVFLTLSATSHAAPLGGGFHGATFRRGFVARSAGTAFRPGLGIRRNFALRPGFASDQTRGFFHRDRRVFFPQVVWPAYCYPYDYSYLDYGPDEEYQYSDNSAAPVQLESSGSVVDHAPIVVIINTGNSRPTDSNTNPAYVGSSYGSNDAAWQQRTVMQDPNEKVGPRNDPKTLVSPPVPQPAQTAAKGAQTTPQARAGVFGNLVLVSWLDDAGKEVIYVQNTETNDVQKITSAPNKDNFRIIEVHPNEDPKQFEVVISNGSQQGPVRFRF